MEVIGQANFVDPTTELATPPFRFGEAGVLPGLRRSGLPQCLHGVPGVAFVVATKKVLEEASGHRASGLYLDLTTNWNAQENGFPAFTPAISTLSALGQALIELKQQGGCAVRSAALFVRTGYGTRDRAYDSRNIVV